MRCLLLLLLLTSSALAQPREAAPFPRRLSNPGEQLISGYFQRQVREIAADCLTGPITKESWEKQRPELRKQFLDSLGLWPLPPRTDLKAQVTGTVQGDGFTVEKVRFESIPGLIVTANLYLPKNLDPKQKLPTILYVCGHANVVQNGVSFGSKVSYQYHPAWFATHGYACLILDTLQLSEIPGIHHGTHNLGLWWWQCRGYTPAGIELWNAMRAIDYLETRSEVDAKRIGVTGRSGGGATSWWVLAGDDRPVCFVPVAGIVDLQSYIVEGIAERYKAGVITGHCDCMFMVNTHRWDFPMVAALAAPRPLLLGNSDADDIFPVPGYRRLAEKVRKVYAAHGAEDKFQLLETEGPHKDTPELRIGINKWMNRWLKNDTKTVVEDDLPAKLLPRQLKVLDRIPEGAINDRVHDIFIKPVSIDLPRSAEVAKTWWSEKRLALLRELEERCFAGWPKQPRPVAGSPAQEWVRQQLRFRESELETEPGIRLPLIVISELQRDPKGIQLRVGSNEDWRNWERWKAGTSISAEVANWLENLKKSATQENQAIALVWPRGMGPTQWAEPGSPTETHIRRRFALIGQTLDGQRVWDLRRAIQLLQIMPIYQKLPLRLQGQGTSAGLALYAGLFEPAVTGWELNQLPKSHEAADGPVFLNVSRVLDLPQALALAAPRPVILRQTGEMAHANWAWPLKLQELLGMKTLKVE